MIKELVFAVWNFWVAVIAIWLFMAVAIAPLYAVFWFWRWVQ